MAGDPLATVALLGMGVDSLSMTVASLPRVKWVLRSVTHRDAQALLAEVMAMESPAAVRRHLERALEQAGVGSLVRAGK